jgi:hypothetical protein
MQGDDLMRDPIFDLTKWRDRVLEIRDQKTQAESLEFCRLVESVEGMNNVEVARTLFKTFTDKPDYGVKETVLRVLATFDLKTYYLAYLEELPRLALETRKQGWFELLATYPGKEPMGQEDCDVLISIVKGMPGEIQRKFLRVISREGFLLHNDWADYVVTRLKTEMPYGEREGDSDAK